MLLTAPEIYNLQNGSAGIRSTLCFRHHPNTSDYETTPGKGNTFSRSRWLFHMFTLQHTSLQYILYLN